MEGKTASRVAALSVAVALVIGGGTGVTATGAASATSGTDVAEASLQHSLPESRRLEQVLPVGGGARTSVVSGSARWSGAVNTYSKSAVNAAYWRDYAPGLSVPTGYTGNDSTCTAGSTSAESREATLRAINFVRSLGGLYPVSLNTTLNARSQHTALMMSANRTLSHHPGSRWRCYSPTGAYNAAKSNLALGYPSITSAGVVEMYMREPGYANYAVGHRRWLMNPFSTQMGTGATNTANSITVIGPTSSYRPNPTWVSWPTNGYFPSTMEPNGRWSLSAGNRAVSFKKAKVRVWRNGVPVRAVKQRVVNGYAMPTMVFQLPASTAKSGSFTVQVKKIRIGKKKYTRTYSVSMFTPWS